MQNAKNASLQSLSAVNELHNEDAEIRHIGEVISRGSLAKKGVLSVSPRSLLVRSKGRRGLSPSRVASGAPRPNLVITSGYYRGHDPVGSTVRRY